jgi:hypothetical protein
MTMTIEQRVEFLENKVEELTNQVATLLPTNDKKSKKKIKNDKPKTKRVSGYILFSNDNRELTKTKLGENSDEKVKSSDVMGELGKMWKALSTDEQNVWNEKAKVEKDTDDKNTKKSKGDSDTEDKPKKKKTSGYILFSNTMRDDTKTQLGEKNQGEKVKNTEVITELGKMWKALTPEEQKGWNEQAAAQC